MAKKSTKKKAASAELPERIFAQASPRSIGGVSLFDADGRVNAETVPNFFSEAHLVNQAVSRLQSAGFEVLQVTPSTINIAGPASAYKEAFGATLVAEERRVMKEHEEDEGTFIEAQETERPGFIATAGTRFDDVLEGVAIEEPRYLMAPSAYPPLVDYWHLRVPEGVSMACNADRAHRTGITGKGIRVAMVDTGFYKHPFFTERGYRTAPVTLAPGSTDPLTDDNGHGTGESANIFAVAPDAELLAVKWNFANSAAAINTAVGLNPDIITCSWGSSKTSGPLSAADMALAAAIATAVANGIIVVFSAGNGHWGFPGQHPDVISAGGVYLEQNGTMRASDYSSGFMSNIYSGRRVPDLSGLVGMRPKAIYLMLPQQEGSVIETGNAGGSHPNGDETGNSDGWAAFSGTSAAAPQLAGAAALLKQACPNLTPHQVRDILRRTAKDVTQGKSHPNTNQPPNSGGNAATTGPDTATGHGLVDAYRAVLLARIRCLGPIQPIGPVQPVQPIGPVQPVQPIGPIGPIQPVQPIQPIQPITPTPILPVGPVRPIGTVNPGPVSPGSMQGPSPGQQPSHQPGARTGHSLTEEDIRALEDLILGSDLSPEDLGE